MFFLSFRALSTQQAGWICARYKYYYYYYGFKPSTSIFHFIYE